MNTTLKYIIGITSIALLTSCGSGDYSNYNEVSNPVKVKPIALTSIQKIVSTTGTAMATKTTEIANEAAGKYQLMKNPKTGKVYQLGDLVNKGTVIIRLSNEAYVNGIQYNSKELGLKIADNEWDAQKRLLKKGGITQKEVNNSESSYINAKYSLETAKINLEKLNIRAPFKSVIVALPYHTANNNIPAGEKLVQLMDYDKMYMAVQFSENNIETVKVGNKINVTNYALKNDTLIGRVSQISPAVNPDTRTFNGYIEIVNNNRKLRPGMFIKADIITQKIDSAIVIPKEIIKDDNGNKTVFIVERNRAREISIKTGLETDTQVQVLSGLEKNQRLIISGYEMLTADSKLKIIK
ncbi:MAG: efflux RND transporter periplasmic adaptor subunit [Marinifilaceae bacterium]